MERKEECCEVEVKYKMTREENIFVAKRNIVDYIWKSARLEGLAVTYPDTEAIFNGMSVQGVKVSDVVAVNNLKHAWQFVLENLDYPANYPFVCRINQLVGGDNLIIRKGFLRNVSVSIGGTTWKPDMPIESKIKEEIADIVAIENPTERGITLMLYLVRRQMFLDGNKQTSMLAGNHVMIASGCGIISVPIELQPTFTKMLIDFYESNDMEPIKRFVHENCIDGIEFTPEPVPQETEPEDELERWYLS